MILTKKQYLSLTKKWKKHGTIYQKWDRYNVRFPTLIKYLDVFKGKKVLEVGCNAGLAGYHIAQVAKEYCGVEEQKGYFRQAKETKEIVGSENMRFMNMSIKSFIKRQLRGDFKVDVNAAFLSYVLYHFSDIEVMLFEKHVLPKLDTIVVMSRFAKRNKKGRRKHNSHGFWNPKNVDKFLQKNGFKTTMEWGPDKKFHFVIGKKFIMPIVLSKGEPTGIQLKKFEEEPDGDNGNSGVHKKNQTAGAKGRSTRQRAGRVSQRVSRNTTPRRTGTKRTGKNVRPQNAKSGSGGILQSGMEKSPETPVRKTYVPKVEEALRRGSGTKTVENSSGGRKPAIQKSPTQSKSIRDKD